MTRNGSRSIWQASLAPIETAPLSSSVQADVCIVGAGIAGMSAAYQLCREGLKVVVLDDGPVGGGNTARTTAHLSSALDDRFSRLERLRGEEASRLAAESHSAAIAEIERICVAEDIACDFRRLDGYLFNAPDQSQEVLEEEYLAARRAGLAVEVLQRAPLAFDTGPALKFSHQGQFHPLKYLLGLTTLVQEAGALVCTGVHVTDIQTRDGVRLLTDGGSFVDAAAAVVATNAPINDRLALHTKQAPYLTYVVAAEVPSGSVTPALYWDTAEPYHYVRLQPHTAERDLLVVGGEDHKTGQAHDWAQRYERLEAWARERFPVTGPFQRWSGQVFETLDGLAYIGRNPGDEAVFVATGDSGMGMTHGTIAGLLLRDLILERPSAWQALYDPARKILRGATEFVRENVNVLKQYAHWLGPGEVASAEELAPGEGALLRRGLAKAALYRDHDGTLYQHSATCPHLGCLVSWNADEKSWDCPCHGSRFDAYGRVVNGPAGRDLEPLGPARSSDAPTSGETVQPAYAHFEHPDGGWYRLWVTHTRPKTARGHPWHLHASYDKTGTLAPVQGAPWQQAPYGMANWDFDEQAEALEAFRKRAQERLEHGYRLSEGTLPPAPE